MNAICARTSRRRATTDASTSRGMASYPCRISTAQTARPLRSEISRSPDSPPINTAMRLVVSSFTPPSVGDELSCSAHDLYFKLQRHAGLLFDGLADLADQRQDVTRCGVAAVHDEVGVQGGDLRVPDLGPFETGCFDEPSGRFPAGVLEDAAGVRERERLRGLPPMQRLLHHCFTARVGIPAEQEPRAHDDALGQAGAAVLESHLVGRQFAHL